MEHPSASHRFRLPSVAWRQYPADPSKVSISIVGPPTGTPKSSVVVRVSDADCRTVTVMVRQPKERDGGGEDTVLLWRDRLCHPVMNATEEGGTLPQSSFKLITFPSSAFSSPLGNEGEEKSPGTTSSSPSSSTVLVMTFTKLDPTVMWEEFLETPIAVDKKCAASPSSSSFLATMGELDAMVARMMPPIPPLHLVSIAGEGADTSADADSVAAALDAHFAAVLPADAKGDERKVLREKMMSFATNRKKMLAQMELAMARLTVPAGAPSTPEQKKRLDALRSAMQNAERSLAIRSSVDEPMTVLRYLEYWKLNADFMRAEIGRSAPFESEAFVAVGEDADAQNESEMSGDALYRKALNAMQQQRQQQQQQRGGGGGGGGSAASSHAIIMRSLRLAIVHHDHSESALALFVYLQRIASSGTVASSGGLHAALGNLLLQKALLVRREDGGGGGAGGDEAISLQNDNSADCSAAAALLCPPITAAGGKKGQTHNTITTVDFSPMPNANTSHSNSDAAVGAFPVFNYILASAMNEKKAPCYLPHFPIVIYFAQRAAMCGYHPALTLLCRCYSRGACEAEVGAEAGHVPSVVERYADADRADYFLQLLVDRGCPTSLVLAALRSTEAGNPIRGLQLFTLALAAFPDCASPQWQRRALGEQFVPHVAAMAQRLRSGNQQQQQQQQGEGGDAALFAEAKRRLEESQPLVVAFGVAEEKVVEKDVASSSFDKTTSSSQRKSNANGASSDSGGGSSPLLAMGVVGVVATVVGVVALVAVIRRSR